MTDIALHATSGAPLSSAGLLATLTPWAWMRRQNDDELRKAARAQVQLAAAAAAVVHSS